MTRENLIEELKKLHGDDKDHEASHIEADDLLIEYINDSEISKAFYAIRKWYA